MAYDLDRMLQELERIKGRRNYAELAGRILSRLPRDLPIVEAGPAEAPPLPSFAPPPPLTPGGEAFPQAPARETSNLFRERLDRLVSRFGEDRSQWPQSALRYDIDPKLGLGPVASPGPPPGPGRGLGTDLRPGPGVDMGAEPEAPPPGSIGGPGPPARPGPQPTPRDIYDYLVGQGVPHEHALGMLANIQGESNFDPSINERNPTVPGSRGGYGLFQHTGPRRRALEEFAGDDVSNWQRQLEFALSEPETAAYLRRAFQSPGEAAEWFTRHWERPDPTRVDEHARRRAGFIDSLLAAIGR